MRASLWRSRLCPDSPYDNIDLVIGPFDEQIVLDMKRTFVNVEWFNAHADVLRRLLNTFSVLNEGFGYPQGVNYLMYPLYYVYYEDNPDTAVMDTLYSLQTLIKIVLPLYPVDSKDSNALKYIKNITNIVCLNCMEREKQLKFLFEKEYEPFMISLVSSLVPTLYANIFSLWDTIHVWDTLFEKRTYRDMFLQVVNILVKAILYHKNMFIHLPMHTCMEVFHATLRQSVCVVAIDD